MRHLAAFARRGGASTSRGAGEMRHLGVPAFARRAADHHASADHLDSPVRDAIALGSNADRHAVGSISDATMGILVSHPFVVDAALVSWAAKGSPDVALQMTMINLQSLAFASLLTGVTKRIAEPRAPGRDRLLRRSGLGSSITRGTPRRRPMGRS